MRGKLDIQEGCCEKCFGQKEVGVSQLSYDIEDYCRNPVCPCHKDTTSLDTKFPDLDRDFYKDNPEALKALFSASEDTTSMEEKFDGTIKASNVDAVFEAVKRLESTPSLPEWSEEFYKIAPFCEHSKAIKSFISKVEAQAEKRTLERAIEALPKEYVSYHDDQTSGTFGDGYPKDPKTAEYKKGYSQALSQAKDSLNKLLTNHE